MDSKVTVPERLLNASELALFIWDYWVGEMRNRNITGSFDFPFWDEMEEEEKQAFVLACQTQVADRFQVYLDAAAFENAFESAFPDPAAQATMPTPPMFTKKKMVPSTCYTCGRWEVNNAGDICDSCFNMYGR